MAALDFPASPSSGQRYIANGSTWEWNGSAWIKLATVSGPTDQVTTTNDTSTAALYPVMVDGAGDNKELKLSTSKLKFDASAGGLTVTGTSGEVTAGVGNTALIVDGDARVLGILTVGSGTVKIDSAGVTATGVATFTNFKTGTTNVHNVGVEAAGINVLGADTPIGTGATVYNSGLIVSKSGGEYQGVVTASTFKGAVEGNVTGNVTGNINGTTGTFSGDVSIGGVLTYEDVTNIDSVGIVTAREGVFIPDAKELKLGNSATSPDLKLYSTGTNGWVFTPQSGADLYMGTNAGEVYIQTGSSGNDTAIKVNSGGSVELNHSTNKKFETTSYGVLSAEQVRVAASNASTVAFSCGDAGTGFYNYGTNKIAYSANGTAKWYVESNGNTVWLDDSKIFFGTGSDFRFWHDGSTNNIWGTGAHPIKIATNSLERLRITPAGALQLSDTNSPNDQNTDIWVADDVLNFNAFGTNGAFAFKSGPSSTSRLTIDSTGKATFSDDVQIDGDELFIADSIKHVGDTDTLISFPSNDTINFRTAGTERLRITSGGQLQQTGTSGLSYFKGSSEYIFGSNTSSPPSGGAEAGVQIHAAKTRAQFSINAYMNNGGGPFMQFVSSRSGTVGTLGTKCQNNDYLGEIRFLGDNATNYNSLCQGASIYAQAASTPADGDTTIAGEIYFTTGTGSGGSSPVRLCIDSAGRLTMNESNIAANAKALRIKADNDNTSNASSDRTGSNSYKNSAIVIQKGISNGGLTAGLIDAWDSSIHATSIGINYTSGRYHTSFGVNNDTNDRPVEIMTISGNKRVKIGGGLADFSASIGLEIGGDGATTEIRLKNSGGGTGTNDGFAIQKWNNGSNYIYDYDSNNILFGTSNGSRTQMDTSGRWTFSPSGAITSGSTQLVMSIVNNGGNANSGSAYPGIAFKSTATGGGNGMALVNFDGNWDLYTRSDNQQGLAILHSNASNSANARFVVDNTGKACVGPTVYDNLATSRYCGTALHVTGGALSIGAKGSATANHRAGVYTLGWYITQHANASFYHLKTDLWAGGSPHGNTEYIMGGFRIEGYSYTSPTGSSTAWIQFHNWNGAYPGLSVKQHYHNWDMNPTVYTSSDGYVVLRVNGGIYKGHVIDLIQHTNYSSRDINVSSTAYNNNATHF